MAERSTTLDEAFDVDTEEGTSAFAPLPPGRYAAAVDDISISVTKNGNGQMVGVRWRIVEGAHEGRLVFDQILIVHTSAEAQRIGRQRFRDMCFACGLSGKVTDLEPLKFKKCWIRVGIERDKDGVYPDKNRVTRIDPYSAVGNGGKPAATEAKPSPMPAPGAKDDLSDEIPF
jgi:hypothetical protein